MIQAAASEGK